VGSHVQLIKVSANEKRISQRLLLETLSLKLVNVSPPKTGQVNKRPVYGTELEAIAAFWKQSPET
jgi:hypothetical protein